MKDDLPNQTGPAPQFNHRDSVMMGGCLLAMLVMPLIMIELCGIAEAVLAIFGQK